MSARSPGWTLARAKSPRRWTRPARTGGKDGRELLWSAADFEGFRHGCTDAESNQIKLHGARRLAAKEAREGSLDPAYARCQAATWEARALAKARESRAGRGGRARAGTGAAGVA